MGSAEDQEGRQLAQIKLEYKNLPTASLKRLDELLLNWARWHSETYVEGFVPREVSSGAVLYSPDIMRLNQSELTVLDDRPAAPNKSATQTMWFNVQYEQKADVPEYDRASALPLSRKRGIIDTIDDGDGVGDAGGNGENGDTGPRSGGGGKRQRTGQRCFNCGSYGHSLRQCWKELDAERVDAERQAMGGGIRGIPKRYFLDEEEGNEGAGPGGGGGGNNGNGDGNNIIDPVEALRKEFPDILPGKLSISLRSALGIGEHDPPPWLHTMRQLGVPPVYNTGPSNDQDVPPPPPPSGGPSPKSHPLQLGPGDEEEEEDGEEGEVVPSPPLDKPVPPEPAEDALEQGNNRPDIDGDEELEDFMALPSEGALRVDLDSTLDDIAPTILNQRVAVAVLFPGVNAPVPAEGDPAAWADRTMQNVQVHWSGENGGSHVQQQQQQHYQQQHYAPPPPPPEHYAQQPYGGYYQQQQQHYHYQPPQPGAPAPPHPGEGAAWQQQQQQWDPAQYHHYAQQQQPWGNTPPPLQPPAPPPPPY